LTFCERAIKGVFFEVSDDGKIKVTQARYCLLIDCQDRNLALTDVHVAIADSQTANGYGIFDLVLSTVHLLFSLIKCASGIATDCVPIKSEIRRSLAFVQSHILVLQQVLNVEFVAFL
jgi:hypothetical protein